MSVSGWDFMSLTPVPDTIPEVSHSRAEEPSQQDGRVVFVHVNTVALDHHNTYIAALLNMKNKNQIAERHRIN